jgi:hypothetical protein
MNSLCGMEKNHPMDLIHKLLEVEHAHRPIYSILNKMLFISKYFLTFRLIVFSLVWNNSAFNSRYASTFRPIVLISV